VGASLGAANGAPLGGCDGADISGAVVVGAVVVGGRVVTIGAGAVNDATKSPEQSPNPRLKLFSQIVVHAHGKIAETRA
jgi:hypothetical protein